MAPSLSHVNHLRCESCESAKYTRASLPTFSRPRSNNLFEVAHSDVWGPLAIPNHAHYKYYVIFIDDYSCMCWLYLMKDRTEVFSKFMLFVNEIQTQHSFCLNVFRSDNALEYTASLFKYYASHGIIHETFCAHTPQLNGVAERKHRHLLEVTRSLMLHILASKHH